MVRQTPRELCTRTSCTRMLYFETVVHRLGYVSNVVAPIAFCAVDDPTLL